MNKPIFENEEEQEEFIKNVIPVHLVKTSEEKLYMKMIRQNIKEYGYLRKSIVDEAEELYQSNRVNHDDYEFIIGKLYDATQYLKNQLELK